MSVQVTRAMFARRVSALAMISTMMIGASAAAQEQAEPQDTADIVVTGFRASLDSALGMKRQEAAAIDSIVAEDIGKFPDSNLAESMQRVPGVALARGDGGEGRNISVRGLGAGFTVSARDADGLVQAIETVDRTFTIGVQWHPEYLCYQRPQRRLFAALVAAARRRPGPSTAQG